MTEYTYVVPGRPIPQGRPRMTRRGRVYTPETTYLHQNLIRDSYKGPLFTDSVEVLVDFDPEWTEITVRDYEYTSPLRGDIDNYLKAVLDGLQPVAFENDRQVMSVWMEKL